MLRKSKNEDFEEILEVINDAAIAYKGVIPPDRWREPYMAREELKAQMQEGVSFSCYVEDDEIVGVMGIQEKEDVALIRHAYVRTKRRSSGIGTLLLRELTTGSMKPILIGTWMAATWAIGFYEKHGFHVVDEEQKNQLLRTYWSIPDRQTQTSVVLVDDKFRTACQ
jgi:N-acetylglutamate synthase-like GNAT family acetyltransferase